MNALILGRWVMDASITGEDALFELPVATRSSLVAIATMRPQACWGTLRIDMSLIDMRLSKWFVQFVTQNNQLDVFAQIVV